MLSLVNSMAEPPKCIAVLIGLRDHGRKLKSAHTRSAKGRLLTENASEHHLRIINDKLQACGVEAWAPNKWERLERGFAHARPFDDHGYWMQDARLLSRGKIVGLALVENSAVLARPLTLDSSERRMQFEMQEQSGQRLPLAFVDVIDAVAIGPFCGQPLPASVLPETLIPVASHLRDGSVCCSFRRDIVYPLMPESVSLLQNLPAYTPGSVVHQRGSVMEVLRSWESAHGARVDPIGLWLMWPPLATLVLHRAWTSLMVIACGSRGSSVRAMLTLPAAPVECDDVASNEPAALSPEMLEGLADHIRRWAPAILAARESEAELGAGSEVVLEGWLDWLDACSRGFRIEDHHFSKGKSGRMLVHHPAKLLAALFISYSVRGDKELASVSKEIISYMCSPKTVVVGMFPGLASHCLCNYII